MSLLEAGAGFLMMPAVQTELGLSAATSKKINDRYMGLMKEFRAPGGAGPKSTPNVSMQDAMKKTLQAQQDALKLLTPAQKTRLRQIAIQQLGAGSLTHPEIKKELGLTDEQTRRISAIVQDGTMQMMKATSNMKMSKDRNEAMKQFTELNKKREEWKAKVAKESLKSLKPDQIAKWKAMQGKPFKVNPMNMGMPRPPRS